MLENIHCVTMAHVPHDQYKGWLFWKVYLSLPYHLNRVNVENGMEYMITDIPVHVYTCSTIKLQSGISQISHRSLSPG